jgi:hypothetical protein
LSISLRRHAPPSAALVKPISSTLGLYSRVLSSLSCIGPCAVNHPLHAESLPTWGIAVQWLAEFARTTDQNSPANVVLKGKHERKFKRRQKMEKWNAAKPNNGKSREKVSNIKGKWLRTDMGLKDQPCLELAGEYLPFLFLVFPWLRLTEPVWYSVSGLHLSSFHDFLHFYWLDWMRALTERIRWKMKGCWKSGMGKCKLDCIFYADQVTTNISMNFGGLRISIKHLPVFFRSSSCVSINTE